MDVFVLIRIKMKKEKKKNRVIECSVPLGDSQLVTMANKICSDTPLAAPPTSLTSLPQMQLLRSGCGFLQVSLDNLILS